MNDRVARLREESFAAPVTLDHERARLVTEFYRNHDGEHPVPMMRALALRHLVEHKTIWIGAGELIVGERGPRPKCVSTYPELTCHSLEDLEILDSRPQNPYRVDDECRRIYRDEVIPFWQGRTMRDRILAALDEEWHQAYAAGLFTEFMEQRAPGHTTLDGKFYAKGLEGFQRDIDASLASVPCRRSAPRSARGHARRRATP